MFYKFKQLASLILLAIVISSGSTQDFNEPCRNSRGDPGLCVPLRECPPMLEIYRKHEVSMPESNFFYGSRCSGTYNEKPLMCCPSSAMLPQPPADCGHSSGLRIFGGTEASLGEFAWTALLVYNNNTEGDESARCAASLINARYAITAAHCIPPTSSYFNLTGVRLGEHDISNDGQDCDQQNICADVPVEVGIEKVIVNADYDPTSKSRFNDIALIRFDRDVEFSDFITPICLPTEDKIRQKNHTATKAFATGWGLTEHKIRSDVKLKVALDIVDHQQCRKLYNTKAEIRNTHLCAGGEEGKDTCADDSGGPLMREIDGNYYLLGVVSFGPSVCGTKNVPGVYTNVAQFMDWIRSKLE